MPPNSRKAKFKTNRKTKAVVPVYMDTGLGALFIYAKFMEMNLGCHGVVLVDDGNGKAGDKTWEQNEERALQLVDVGHDCLTEFPPECKSSLADDFAQFGEDHHVIPLSIIACNTLSIAIQFEKNADKIRERGKHVLGIPSSLITGFVQNYLELEAFKLRDRLDRKIHIALLGTAFTINSGYYQNAIKGIWPGPWATVTAQGCSGLADMIDNGASYEELKDKLREYINPKKIPNIKTVTHYAGVCTHYAAVDEIVRELFAEHGNTNVQIMDHAAWVEKSREKYVNTWIRKQKEKIEYPSTSIFLTTGDPEKMNKAACNFQKLLPEGHPLKGIKIEFKNINLPLAPTMENFSRILGAPAYSK